MICKGRILKHEEGEPIAFVVQGKKKKGRRGIHNSRKSSPKSSSQWTKHLSKVQCYNCHKHGHYACDCSENKRASKFNFNNRSNKSDYRRSREAPSTRTENYRSSRNQRYDNNVVETQSKYFLVSALSSSSHADSCDSSLVDSGASRHFTGYKEVLSNLVERETDLKIVLRDNSTYPIKGSGYVSFYLDQGKTLTLQEVLYVPSLKKNIMPVSSLEDKRMKVAFINGKVLTWPSRSNIRDALTLGSICEGLYKINY